MPVYSGCVLVGQEKTRTQLVETGDCVLVGCLEVVCRRSDWVRGGCFAQFLPNLLARNWVKHGVSLESDPLPARKLGSDKPILPNLTQTPIKILGQLGQNPGIRPTLSQKSWVRKCDSPESDPNPDQNIGSTWPESPNQTHSQPENLGQISPFPQI